MFGDILYNPHLEDCVHCGDEFTDEFQPISWFEHFMCWACAYLIRNGGL